MDLSKASYEYLEFKVQQTISRIESSVQKFGVDTTKKNWINEILSKPEILKQLQPMTTEEIRCIIEKTRQDCAKISAEMDKVKEALKKFNKEID